MKVHELARWTRFAAKGGIGKCTAVHDCVAQSSDDLMFLKDDEIIVLMQLQEQADTYLGYCEGVVGRFEGSLVKFHGPLKRPVLTKRASSHRIPSPSHFRPPTNSPRPSPSPVPHSGPEEGLSLPVSLTPSPLHETTHPETTPPPTDEDIESHDFDDELLAPPSLASHSSASSAIESAPATPADFDSDHHTQDVESEPHLGGSPSSLENPRFDDTKDLDTSFVPSEQSTRLSVETIDGTEGIGLSLLQNFMGSGGEDDSDASSDTDMAGYARQGSPDSTLDDHGLNYDSTPPQSVDGHHPVPLPESVPSSPTSPGSRVSHVSSHPSEYSDQGGEEWEGASDIYDNYRYSRFSIASKMSRFSRGSVKAPPPIPLSGQRHSFEQEVIAKRPAPLDLEVRSPLLHTTFGSPLNSPGEHTATSTISVPLSTAGIATAIRYRLESERSPEVPTTTDAHLTPAREGEIVISDDEEGPEVVTTSSSSRPSSPTEAGNETFDSTASSQSREDDSITTDETVLFVHLLPETQPLRLQKSPTSPPQETHPAPPPQSLTIAQPRPSKPPAFDFGSSRTSMFLPHPGAPKAPGTAPVGPLYGRVQSPPSLPGLKHPQTSLTQLLHVAATTLAYPNGAPRKMTVYGICEIDLASATGPVSITFSLEPPISVPANRTVPHRSQSSDTNQTPPSSQPSTPTNQSFSGNGPSSSPTSTGTGPNSGTIPRPNFFPQKPQIRPRSRSFSGFDSMPPQVNLSLGTSEDDAQQQNSQSKKSQSKGGSNEPPRPISSRRPNTMNRPVHKPSPLSLPQNSISSDTSADTTIGKLKAPLSATAASFPSPISPRSFNSPPLAASPALSVPTVLRQAVSSTQLRTPSTTLTPTILSKGLPSSVSQGTDGTDDKARPIETVRPSVPLDEPRPSTSSSESSRKQGMADIITLKSPNKRSSFDTDVSRTSDTRSTSVVSPSLHSTSPPPGALRPTSLRSKLSKTAILAKTSGLENPGEIQSPTTSTSGTETVQVQHMDFELIKPSFPRTLSPQSSLDSFSSQQYDNDHQTSSIRQDATNFLRTESPSSLLSSGVSERERDAATANRRPSPSSIAQSDILSPSDIDAHRNRELKWISLMSTLDPTQARKSKKAKKLLLNGVPASVRYQVWAHLADCKGKRMNGLYPQLVKRGAVPVTPGIVRDSADKFGHQPQGKDGSIVSVLQAYLTMVPDVQYHIALTCIVGQLLAQSPEEDAFWIFISMMDSYLRPYFSSSVTQLDFDATLFARALEANDAPLAKRILVDMSIPPLTICRQWFLSLFYDSIPAEYHLRVWDVFLFEGVPFLFRVGLALFTCCRRPLLEAQSRDRALSILSQVPAQCLPPNGDALIELAMSKKLKDDDVRKSRSKVETQKKRTTSTRLLKSSANPGAPISLPRG